LSWRKKPKISPNFVLEEMGEFVCNPSRCGSKKSVNIENKSRHLICLATHLICLANHRIGSRHRHAKNKVLPRRNPAISIGWGYHHVSGWCVNIHSIGSGNRHKGLFHEERKLLFAIIKGGSIGCKSLGLL
jgi:hypothetical protein